MSHRVLAVGAAIALAGLAGCGEGDDESQSTTKQVRQAEDVAFTGSIEEGLPVCYPTPRRQDLTIGFPSPLQANELVNVTSTAMKLEAEALGGRLRIVDSGADPDKQVSATEQLIAQKVDGLIMFPLNPQALQPVLRKAQAAGIPVLGIEVNLNSTNPGPGYATQIWQRRDYMSYLQAKAAAERLKAGSKIAQSGFVVPIPTGEKQVERAAYWARRFGLRPITRVNNKTDDIAGGEKVMTEVLAKHPDITGLIAYNEETATGAASATRAQGKRDVVLVGNNGGSVGFSSVKSDKIDATVQVQVPDLGRCAVRGIYDLVQRTPVPKTVVTGAPKLVTRETIDRVPTWDAVLQQRYGKTR